MNIYIPLFIYIYICVYTYCTNRLPSWLARRGIMWDRWCLWGVCECCVFCLHWPAWPAVCIYICMYRCSIHMFVCVPVGNTYSASLLTGPGDMKLQQPRLWQATGFGSSQQSAQQLMSSWKPHIQAGLCRMAFCLLIIFYLDNSSLSCFLPPIPVVFALQCHFVHEGWLDPVPFSFFQTNPSGLLCRENQFSGSFPIVFPAYQS